MGDSGLERIAPELFGARERAEKISTSDTSTMNAAFTWP